MTTPTRVVTAGADLLADAVAAPGRRRHPRRLAPADGRHRGRPGDRGARTRCAATPTRGRSRRCSAVTAPLVDVAPASRGARPASAGSSCTPGRRSTWERASGPLRGALMGGAALEGLVDDPEDAVALFEAGAGVSLEPCHHRRAVGPDGRRGDARHVDVRARGPGDRAPAPTARSTRASARCCATARTRPRCSTGCAGCATCSGRCCGRRARRGADRGRSTSPAILTQMLQMGDEAHNRNRAGTLMLLRDLAPAMVEPAAPTPPTSPTSLRFVGGNDHFFLNLAMPACKLALDAARDIAGSTMVVAMARNGTDFGIQVAGTGDEWFTGPAQVADGLFLGDYGPDDANPDIGDSAITETAGIGGFAMATAPAIVRFVGGSVPDALATTRRMHEITLGENPRWSVPVLEFQGTPDRHRRHPGVPHRHPAADQHRHGRQAGRRRPGRRRAGHAARRRSSRRRSPGSPSSPGPGPGRRRRPLTPAEHGYSPHLSTGSLPTAPSRVG